MEFLAPVVGGGEEEARAAGLGAPVEGQDGAVVGEVAVRGVLVKLSGTMKVFGRTRSPVGQNPLLEGLALRRPARHLYIV